jgi:hypothetical protein
MLAILSVWKKVVVVLRCCQRWFYFPTSDKGCGSVASCACFYLGVRRRWFGFLLPAVVVVLRVFCFGGRQRWFCFRRRWWSWLLLACSVLVFTGGVLFPATVVAMFCACSVLVFIRGGSVSSNCGGSGADALFYVLYSQWLHSVFSVDSGGDGAAVVFVLVGLNLCSASAAVLIRW